MKKTLTIGIILLFLFSTLPIVIGNDLDENLIKYSLKTDNAYSPSIEFVIIYGKIVNHGDEMIGSILCYNFTPINVRFIDFYWYYFHGYSDYDFSSGRLTDDPYYLPYSQYFHGFVGQNHIFLWYWLMY